MTAKDFLEKDIERGLEFLIDKAKEELKSQGHRVTGRLEKSLEAVITFGADVIRGQILVEEYGIYLDKGVKPPRIPYQRGSGAGRSQYIQSLLEWAKKVKPSLSDKARKSFVFAVANKQKKEGNPTRGSYVYSSNGRRKGWIKHGLENPSENFDRVLDLEKYAELLLDEFFQDFEFT